ncbi:CheY-like chemotaxis protein [Rheinheimera pacifica]|uniref:response regulator n=1 Tax=Rheinheimera pacifica TaxID=173990 RepID=UPI00216A55E8|nr:response regulator [Rheinheimera pacifica]MCS4305934.1 CheY-like chemotaxis protein [Rheinheimera pacifica]
MTNHFRQLTLPWLIALSLMLLFTALWYHYESKIMQRAQVQQYTASLQFSIRPLLANKNPDLLKAQLNHLRYASVLPVSAIAVYSDTGRLISGTDKAALLPRFQPEQMQHEFHLLHEAGTLFAVQPMSSSAASSGYDEVIAGQNDNYYVVVQLDAPGNYSVWLVPVLVVAMLGWGALLAMHGSIGRVSQRQQTDISLLVHKLSQLKQGQLNSRLDDELVPELAPLKLALNELAGQQITNRSRDDTEKNQLKQQIAELTQSLVSEKQQSVQVQKLYEQSKQQQLQQILQLRQLTQQQAVIPDKLLRQALHSQLTLAELTQASEPEPLTQLVLTEYVARQLPHYRNILAAQNLTLQLNEAAANAVHQLALPESLLTMLLTALLRLSSHSDGITELTLNMQLSVTCTTGSLLLSVTGNGDGLLASVKQQLVNPGPRSTDWQDSDSQIVTLIANKLNAAIEVQSLEGLGSTVSVRISIADCQPLQVKRLNHLLLFDQLPRLTERKAALGSLVANVAQSSDLAELQHKAEQYQYDAALIFLPEPAGLAAWLELIQRLTEKTKVLCYAEVDCIQMWREALGVAITEEPFCLAELQQIKTADNAKLPKLLVVDDNPTNLAFIQMLLKLQPLELTTANCAQQALQLCALQQFDVILLDIQLPDMHGTEVARQLRQMQAYQLTPILAFTAHALAEEVASFKAAGMNDVIFKPLEVNKLQQILHWCSSVKTDNTGQ